MSKYVDRLIAAGKDELWEDETPTSVPAEPVEKHEFAVVSDRFDRMTWDDINFQVSDLALNRMNLGLDYPTGAQAYEDLFNLLWQGNPVLRGTGEMETDFLGNLMIAGGFHNAPYFPELRRDASQDSYTSAFTMIALTPTLRAALDAANEAQSAQEDLTEALEALEPPPAPAEDGEAPSDEAEDGQEMSAPGHEMSEEEETAAIEALDQAVAAAAKAGDALDKAVAQLAYAAAEAATEAKESAEAAKSFGIGTGELDKMSYEQRKALSERLHKGRLAQLAKLIGSFRMFGSAERRRRVQHAPSERHDIVLGNDLTALTTSELVHLAVPELEELFWLRYVKHSLLNVDVRGTEKAGQGPIVVICDESYSMDEALDADGNTREAWSKAVSLALCDQAQHDNRDFTYIGFAGHKEIYERSFPGGRRTLEGVIDFAEHYFKGGTLFEPALRRGLEVIAATGNKPRPDVVFITDGESDVSPEFLTEWTETLHRLDARCFGIQVGDEPSSILGDIAHKTMKITKLTASPAGVASLFRTI